MDETPEFMSFAAFARHCHVAKSCVTGWRRRGLVVVVDGKVDVAASNARLAARPTISRGGVTKVRPAVADVPKSGAISDVPKSGSIVEVFHR